MNNGIKYIAIGMLATGLAVSTYATGNIEVDWSASDVTGIALANGTPAPSGTMELGVFSGTPNVALTGFTGWVTNTTALGDDGAGFFNNIKTIQDDSAVFHQQMYLVVQSGTQQGIFTDTQWIFPANSDIPNQISIDVENLVTSPGSSSAALSSAATIVEGAFLPQNVDTYSYLELHAVPEPSTIALVVMSLLGGIGLIRRRRS